MKDFWRIYDFISALIMFLTLLTWFTVEYLAENHQVIVFGKYLIQRIK